MNALRPGDICTVLIVSKEPHRWMGAVKRLRKCSYEVAILSDPGQLAHWVRDCGGCWEPAAILLDGTVIKDLLDWSDTLWHPWPCLVAYIDWGQGGRWSEERDKRDQDWRRVGLGLWRDAPVPKGAWERDPLVEVDEDDLREISGIIAGYHYAWHRKARVEARIAEEAKQAEEAKREYEASKADAP